MLSWISKSRYMGIYCIRVLFIILALRMHSWWSLNKLVKKLTELEITLVKRLLVFSTCSKYEWILSLTEKNLVLYMRYSEKVFEKRTSLSFTFSTHLYADFAVFTCLLKAKVYSDCLKIFHPLIFCQLQTGGALYPMSTICRTCLSKVCALLSSGS